MQDNRGLFLTKSGTFGFLAVDRQIKSISLVHSDLQGTILFEYQFFYSTNNDYPQMTLFDDNLAIFTQRQRDRLALINLKTHQVNYFEHKFIACRSDRIRLHIFSETDLLCVQERIGKSFIKLTYYCLPFAVGQKPFAVYQSRERQFKYPMKVAKANNHSMIVWFDQALVQNYILYIFNLSDTIGGNYSQIKITNYKEQTWTRLVLNVWQKKRGEFLLITQGHYRKYTYQIFRLEADNSCIWQSSHILNCQFQQLVHSHNMGKFSFIVMSNKLIQFQKLKTLDRTLYINNETQEIVGIENTSSTYKKVSYFFPSYNPCLLYKIIYDINKMYPAEITIIQREMFNQWEVILHFLIHLNDDFDDDLLKDAVQLIDYSNKYLEEESQDKISGKSVSKKTKEKEKEEDSLKQSKHLKQQYEIDK